VTTTTSAITAVPSDVIRIYQSMSALALEMGAVNLAQGVPEPVHDDTWRAALAAALPTAHFQYTPTRGTPALRGAIGGIYDADPDRIIVTSGCTESLAAALSGLARTGHRTVVWLEPFYSYYPGLARIAGLDHRGVAIDLSGPTPRLDLDGLRATLAPFGERAVLLLNTPHNPSGLVLHGRDWADLRRLVADTGCFLLLDDAYRDFRYGPSPAPYAALLATGRAAIAGSASKSFAATGIRLGWLLAPQELGPVAESVHMHLSNCTPDLVQQAAVRVIEQVTPDVVAQVRDRYRRKRDALLTALTAAGLRTLTPAGGHFVMARPPDGGSWRTGTDYALALAPALGVVPLPLESFFAAPGPPWLRFSFAVSEDDLATACRRLSRQERTGHQGTGHGGPDTWGRGVK